jgi:glyoxylase-like metal-dependent hydrolase (beta-lactamase superfamily II)
MTNNNSTAASTSLTIQVQPLVINIDPRSGFTANCYLVWQNDSDECVLIDAPAQPELILDALDCKKITTIVLTHKHFDHVGAAASLVAATGAKIYAHELDAGVIEQGSRDVFGGVRNVEPCKVDVQLKGDEALNLAGIEFDVLHTPGHSKGSICLLNSANQVLFSGDTIFRGTTGRTDLDGGSPRQMHESLIKLSKLNDSITVLPGHDAPTTIGYERTRSLVEY